MNNNKRYQNIDFANGGDIRGMLRATDAWLKVTNDQTKVVVGMARSRTRRTSPSTANAADVARPHREAVREGKTEAEGGCTQAARRSRRQVGRHPEAAVAHTPQRLQFVQAAVTIAN